MVAVANGDGDLTTRIAVARNDEIGQVARAFNDFTESLRGILHEVKQASSEVKTAAHEIATGNADLSSRTEGVPMDAPATVEAYLAALPERQRAALEDLRRTIRAAAPDLVELTLRPAMNATARFGIVTLARRAEAPALPIVRKLMEQFMRD